MSLPAKNLLIILGIALVASVVLAELYFVVNDLGFSAWVAAALVNSALGCVMLVFYFIGKLDGALLTDRFKYSRWWAYLPAAVVMLLSALVAFISFYLIEGGQREPLTRSLWITILGWAVWVPICEETLFRVGIGGFFRKLGGVFWGSYFSVAFFSFMHTLPTWDRVLTGEVGFTLGTLLLGLCCEVIWVFTKNLGAIVSFHAACNFTVVIFSYMDARWLTWLGPLYL